VKHPLPIPPRQIVLALLVSSLLLLPACGRPAARQELDFNAVLADGWHIARVDRLDADDDEELEWVILYTYDEPDNAAFAPIQCAIYDLVRREPRLPIVYPYHLRAPGWTYLGEGVDRTKVTADDVVTNLVAPTGTQLATSEVIVTSKDADGFVRRVSIFQWRDNVQNKHIDPQEVVILPNLTGQKGQWYECIGFFEGSQIEVSKDTVTVRDRVNDRSQLARVKTYRPSGTRGYLLPDNTLKGPSSSCLDFAYNKPENLIESPYPEKIVLAFQKQFMEESDYGARYLSARAQQARKDGRTGNWRLFQQKQVDRICVSQIEYDSQSEAQAQAEAFKQGIGQVSATVKTRTEIAFPRQQPQKVDIVWGMIKTGNRWKIDAITSIRPAE